MASLQNLHQQKTNTNGRYKIKTCINGLWIVDLLKVYIQNILETPIKDFKK